MTEAGKGDGPRIALIEGNAVIHRAFGGAGVESRRSPRQNAHDTLMKAVDAAGNPAPKCFHVFEGQNIDDMIHSPACDEATDLLTKLRRVVGQIAPQRAGAV